MGSSINIEKIMENALCASGIFGQLSQEHTDRIVRAIYEAGFNNRVYLAKMAEEETGMGKWKDKVIKNVVATQFVYEDIKNLKTVGVISEDETTGISEIAHPIGPILIIIPVTNPTSTTLFKILIAMKTRNPVIISPHRNASKCAIEAAKICYEAALKMDAPEDCIQWVTHTSREETQKLMSHKSLALILATGGGGLVKAAYSSGTPAIGVGAGNVPVFIEKTADIPFTVEQILLSKTFDNGTICCSEQAVVVEKSIAFEVIEEFKKQKAYFLSEEEVKKIEPVVFEREKKLMNAGIVGKSVSVIAKMADLVIPEDTRLLIAPVEGVGNEYPLSSEILAPILAFYVANDFEQAVKVCIDLNYHGGIGHTASIFSNNDAAIRQFALLMNAGRVVVNTPSAQGGVGGIYNTLSPSLTLGCGTGGKNITTDNITAKHLLNIQRIARRRTNERLERFDKTMYLSGAYGVKEIEEKFNRNY